jgi:hypothetical protein
MVWVNSAGNDPVIEAYVFSGPGVASGPFLFAVKADVIHGGRIFHSFNMC